MSYEAVVQILRSPSYGWSVLGAPHPDPVGIALKEHPPEAVAATLDAYVYAQAATILPPYGTQESAAVIFRRRRFTVDCKFWSLNTSLALGQQHELPVDTIGPAQSPTEWWDAQERLRNRLGEKLCSAEEFARRNAHLEVMPMEWTSRDIDPVIYQLAVREGYMPVGMTGFDPAYLQTNPRLKDVRGLSALQWLQNIQATDRGKPWPWLPGGAPNPVAK